METEEFKSQELSPEEIKKIRQSLNLTQAEAGKRLGGGPSAFAKYENGSVKPSVALTRILRFLKERPKELQAISGEPTPAKAKAINPLEVTADNISELSPYDLSALTEKLLSAEAQAWNLPLDRIHVAPGLTAPDGGEDARIEWQGGRQRTDFLPNRFCQFQLKSGNISPGKAGAEVIDRHGSLKPMVKKALESGGSYIMVCSKPYTQQKIERRIEEIRKSVEHRGIKEPHIGFYDSSKIASWVNSHPSVAAWLLRKTRPGHVSSFFGDWEHWSQRSEHNNSPWIKDSRLSDLRKKLREVVKTPRGVAHVVGPDGSGKSRLVLEALGTEEEERMSGVRLKDLVLYAVESEADSSRIKEYAWNLANSQRRAVLVIDSCSEQTRVNLANIAKHLSSRLSLVTIVGHKTSSYTEESENALVVTAAENILIEEIVKSIDSTIPESDRRRITALSEGNIGFAQVIAKSWWEKGLTALEDEELLIQNFLEDNQGDIYEAAMLVSVLEWIEIKTDYGKKSELEEIAESSLTTLSAENLLSAFRKLTRRGVIFPQGNFVTLVPEHMALFLARRQWDEWGKEQWEKILTGTFHKRVRVRAAKRLAHLNMKPTARRVTDHILKKKKNFLREKWKVNTEILLCLAEIDSQGVVNILERILLPLPQAEIKSIEGTTRRDLVLTLSKIAFANKTFENGAVLLFKLALGENENIINNATGQFKSLFPVILGNTEAGLEKRLAVINELIDEYKATPDPALSIIVDALLEGAKTRHFHRFAGPEIHGSRPALESWMPKTYEEYWSYIKECARHLIELAKRPDHIGKQARAGLGQKWPEYILDGLIEDVEKWTHEIKEKHTYWPEALSSLEILMHSKNKLEPDVEKRVENLISALTPLSLDDRIQFLITEMPFRYLKRKSANIEEMYEIQRKELKKLAGGLLEQETKLSKLIPELCAGQHRNARLFGYLLAGQARNPFHWKKKITGAFESVPPLYRNSEFLTGYMMGLGKGNPKELERFKRESAKSPVLAPILPALTLYTGISTDDVEITIETLKSGFISPREIPAWQYGKALSSLQPEEVKPLFDFLLNKEDSVCFGCAIDLMHSYAYEQKENLEYFRPQLLLVAKYPAMKTGEIYDKPQHEDSYEALMSWIISKGTADADAREVAIITAKQLTAQDLSYYDERMIIQVLPDLLSNFSEIVWPIIGRTLEEKGFAASRLSMILSEKPTFEKDKPPIMMSVPENILFGWCHASPETAPAFVARTVPLLKEGGKSETGSEELNPTIKRLMDEFGERQDVLDGLESNINFSSPLGSGSGHPLRYKKLFQGIENRNKGPVRRWAKKVLDYIDRSTSGN